MSQKDLRLFLERERSWLEQKLANTIRHPRPTIPPEILLLGQAHTLHQRPQHSYAATQIQRIEDQLYLFFPQDLQDKALIQDALARFFMQESRDYMLERLSYWSSQMQLMPKKVRFKFLRSRWGSCSARLNINLNVRAIQLPPGCIDAILVHELAHLRHLNHGPLFWALVHEYFPNYQYYWRQIRNFQEQLQ